MDGVYIRKLTKETLSWINNDETFKLFGIIFLEV